MKPSVPTQLDCDCVASYVEAVEELKIEPFFSDDNKASLRWTDGQETAHFGDRFHFRSALATFRRIWLNDEASSFFRVCKLLKRFETASLTTFILRDEHKKYTSLQWGKIGLNSGQVVDLWLNAVFAHSNLTRSKAGAKHWHDRIDFDRLVKSHGNAFLEFICRTTVSSIGRCCYIQSLSDARHALNRWEHTFGLRPQFEIGLPFGKGSIEKLSDGMTVFRMPSTEFLPNESRDQRFKRILGRENFSSLRALTRSIAEDDEAAQRQITAAKGDQVAFIQIQFRNSGSAQPQLEGACG